jgi:alpha-glucosidase (family GH31 glycosyl hydrolase)
MRVSCALLISLAVASPRGGTAQAKVAATGELPIAWEEAAPGVWSAAIGTPDRVSLLEAAGARPQRAALERLATVTFPLNRQEVHAVQRDGRIVLRLPLSPSEELYGLGLEFKSILQRGTVKQLHVDHYAGVDNGRTHAPVPLYVSSQGYGVLIDAPRYITVYAGTAVRRDTPHPPPVKDRNTDRTWSSMPRSDAVEIVVPTLGVRLYVFGGPSPLDAVRRYNLFSGGGVLPPKWGLGFLHRVPTLYTADQVVQEVDEFAARGYPLDVVGLEPGWQSAAYPGTFAWDSRRYADPDAFLRRLRERAVRVNLWMNPYVSPSAPLYRGLEPLSGSHTVWTGIVPDITLAETQRLVTDFFRREHLDRGVSGYKIDEVDGYDRWLWPDHATFPSGLDGEQMRAVYGVSWQRVIAEMFRARGQRTYGLVRASNAGAASLPYVIYNDYYSHPDFITALVNSSFIGVLWTPEVRSSKTGEEWLRRMQSVCFSPLAMLNAWSDGTKPWTFADVAAPVREVMRLRIRLLPYLYTAFARYHFDGTPPFRALPLVEGFGAADTVASDDDPGAPRRETRARRDIKDEFLVGESLLVAPMFAGQSSRTVFLPNGRWYDFYTGQYAGEGGSITVTPGLDRIPLFVRDGGIIPMLTADRLHVPAAHEQVDLEVRHYGGAPARWELYDDDGTTFEYERGAFTWTELAVTRDASGALRGSVRGPPAGKPFSYRVTRWRMMSAQ